VTMKNAVFWDIETHFIPYRRQVTSLLQSQDGQCYVRFEVFKAVTMKNSVFWDVALCGSSKNRCVGGTYRFHHQCDKNRSGRNDVSSN
jgi:hypothetical protein